MLPYDILSAYYDTLIFDLIILFLFIKICFGPYLRYHLIFPLKINIEKENHSPSDNEGEKGKNKTWGKLSCIRNHKLTFMCYDIQNDTVASDECLFLFM